MGRMVLELSCDDEVKIDELARNIDSDRIEVFRRALGLLMIAVDARDQGKRFGIVDSEGKLETEIIGL